MATKKQDPVLERAKKDVAEHGWHVIKVFSDGETGPPFAYTIGFETTFRQPEVVIFGLNDDLEFMHHVLNGIGDRMRRGEKFAHGDVKKKILDGFGCPFVRVPKSAYEEHLGIAMRYHGGTKFRALQCIWPDPKKKLPWDPKVMPPVLRREPILGRPTDARERSWPFADSHSRWVFTTRQVVTGAEPIRFAGRFRENGEWQFVCNTTGDENDLVMATLSWALDHDPSLAKIAKLRPGECAERASAKAAWKKGKMARE
jgi:hypothetical protein